MREYLPGQSESKVMFLRSVVAPQEVSPVRKKSSRVPRRDFAIFSIFSVSKVLNARL